MKDNLIREIEQAMLPYLDNAQMKQLQCVLDNLLWNKQITIADPSVVEEPNDFGLMNIFISSKKVEGCSDKTLRYYKATIEKMLLTVNVGATHITTDHIRQYLARYEQESKCSKANIDNIRRILSSFFSWLEDENYILKNPVRRIHKIKTTKPVKEVYTDEALEIMRDNCGNIRDLAIIDLLASSGIRVGELVNLNIADVDFENRECVVLGKGNKERPVYFDARTKIHLKNYLLSRDDDNPALFVSLLAPHNRLEISGVEIRLRKLGRMLNIPKVHPHKFRRYVATRAIDKGMPVELLQRLLGHSKIETTMEYAMVNQTNVKISHRRFIG